MTYRENDINSEFLIIGYETQNQTVKIEEMSTTKTVEVVFTININEYLQ